MSQSLDRGLRLLDEIAAGRTTLSEMSESLEVHKTTVLRLLSTLQQHHFVHRSDQFHYQLGRKLFDLASFAIESREVVAEARAPMQRLMRATGHALYLATLEAGEAVIVAAIAGRGALRGAVRIGQVLPLHATAAGKVLTAELSPDEVSELVDAADLQRFTSKTITDLEALRIELDKVRSSGLALEIGEHDRHVYASAAPIRDPMGRVVAAMAMTLPSVDDGESELTSYLPELLAACDRVSVELGWG